MDAKRKNSKYSCIEMVTPTGDLFSDCIEDGDGWGGGLKMSNGLITIFARKEPTEDSIAKQYASKHALKNMKDVVFYRDAKLSIPFARWSWFNNPPRKGTQKVTLKCWNWSVEWIN